MANNTKIKIDGSTRYTAREAADLLELTEETIKKKCRDGEIEGKQVGAKKKWHIQGKEIIRLRKLWNLDEG